MEKARHIHTNPSKLANMSKIFFDANILLDILLSSRPNHTKALEAYIKICDSYSTLATSENILTTIEYIANKNGTSCEIITEFFIGLRENFELYGFASVLGDSLDIYQSKCKQRERLDFEDLLQLRCAINNNCTAFITQDKEIHKLNMDLKIYSLDDILAS